MTDGPPAGWDCHVHVFDAQAPVRSGHYRPVNRSLPDAEAQALALGVRHLVLVQPSVYGSDNQLLVEALRAHPGRHRGVVVLGDRIDPRALDRWHDAGVRGARLNRVSPVGDRSDPRERFAQLAPALADRGWHLQWYARPADLPAIADLHARPGAPTAVLDHLAGMHAASLDDAPAWQALARLATAGAWVKLSGWYRLGDAAPYTRLLPVVQRLAGLFPDRLVWGSDWPHTSFEPGSEPGYAQTWEPVLTALGADAAADVLRAGARLYA